MDERQRAYLEAMEIPIWELRNKVGATPENQIPEDDGAPAETTVSEPQSETITATEPQPERPELIPAEPQTDKPELENPSNHDTQRVFELEAIKNELFSIEEELEQELPETEHSSPLQLDWDKLEEHIKKCTQCTELVNHRTQTVFGVGNRDARLMIIGEAPGADEDRQGEPFVGKAGQLLNLMIQAIGYQRQEVYIANVLKCRPPNNRDPQQQEITACRGYLQRQVELVKPDAILIVGRIAAQSMLNTTETIGKIRGKVYQVESIPTIVTYHPAYLLRSPQEKAKSWSDLRLLISELNRTSNE